MEWFASWFDSPYYPMLYRHRDEEEAKKALTNLHSKLSLPTGATVLDLGCGEGYVARTLAAKGTHSVLAYDISAGMIEKAREAEAAQPLGIEYRVGKYGLKSHGKAIADGAAEGLVKIIVSKKYGEILGAHIIGAHATELIHEIAVARENEYTVEEIGRASCRERVCQYV